MRFTVVGASGFIGSALVETLRRRGDEVLTPARDASLAAAQPMGHLVYAAGVTADFRQRPFETLRANTELLADLLEHARFDSLTYLSSARLYRHAEHSREDAAIHIRPHDPEDLYDLTKLTAEALCAVDVRPQVRVVRLSNVVGADVSGPTFIPDLIRSACDTGAIRLRSAPESAKDYVTLDDVVDLLPRIATDGRARCYNVASGRNLTHAEVVAAIGSRVPVRLTVAPNASAIISPPIDIGRVGTEFDFQPQSVLSRIPDYVDAYRSTRAS